MALCKHEEHTCVGNGFPVGGAFLKALGWDASGCSLIVSMQGVRKYVSTTETVKHK
jgi:hypothetical protein